jgi:prepilin-type N-terminal cleavage/methylation domain-containing protein
MRNPQSRGFSLLELLVVISIMGLMAGLSVPAFKQMRKGHAMRAAFRQLQDDLGYARHRAIVGRSTVYVVFLTSEAVDVAYNKTTRQMFGYPNTPPPDSLMPHDTNNLSNWQLVTNLFTGQYTAYALYADRRVGDQPGMERPRYLTDWKNLPEGVFFWPDAFLWDTPPRGLDCDTNLVWAPSKEAFPFPSTDSRLKMYLPYIAFNSDGSLKENTKPFRIQIAQGPVGVGKGPDGLPAAAYVDIVEKTPDNHTNNRVVIDWLTGRARIERPEIQ